MYILSWRIHMQAWGSFKAKQLGSCHQLLEMWGKVELTSILSLEGKLTLLGIISIRHILFHLILKNIHNNSFYYPYLTGKGSEIWESMLFSQNHLFRLKPGVSRTRVWVPFIRPNCTQVYMSKAGKIELHGCDRMLPCQDGMWVGEPVVLCL